MRLAVIMDGDGHFRAAPLRDREKVMEILEASDEGGDRIENDADNLTVYEKDLWYNYKIISNAAWEGIIGNFTQRSTFEILEI